FWVRFACHWAFYLRLLLRPRGNQSDAVLPRPSLNLPLSSSGGFKSEEDGDPHPVKTVGFCPVTAQPPFGSGVDHSAIVGVLTNRSREQRQLISRAFQERTQQVRPLTSQEQWTGLRTTLLKSWGTAVAVVGRWLVLLAFGRNQLIFPDLPPTSGTLPTPHLLLHHGDHLSQDLLKSLQAALSGDLERTVVALLQPAAHFDAQELRTALKTPGSTEDVAVEILATRSPPQLQECLTVYKHNFQMEAEKDIKSETSGIFQDLLLALAEGTRESYSGIIDYNLVEQDVQALKQAEGPGTEGTWVLIFTQRNPEHLVQVFDQYQRCTGHELEKAVQNIFLGDAQAALLSLALVIKNTPLYFADKLHQALQDTEPNYQVLMRILISRSEIDLLSIRTAFKKKFGKSLYSSLQDVVKGDCRSALLALCRAEDL
uniref:Annexin A9 n=1 Tax=Suricata suricatta TaxID=37032 RepID=A0A673TE62_SURSU